jgi:hypothetical protein
MHGNRNAALAIGHRAEQELLSRVRDQDAAYRLVGHPLDFGEQLAPMAIGRSGVDRQHAGRANDESCVAVASERHGIDFARNALQHVDAARDFDRVRGAITVAGRRCRAACGAEHCGGVEQPGEKVR